MIEVKCLSCGHEVKLPVTIVFEYYVCPQCFKGHAYDNGVLSDDEKRSGTTFESHIKVGQSAFLDDVTFWVSNVILKEAADGETWREYELVSATGKYKYLTEEGGNWTISEPIEPGMNFDRLEIHYNDMDFPLFDKGSFCDSSGVGFFDIKIGKNQGNYRDFVCPPYVLSTEIEEKVKYVYYGEHISRNEVKKLFNLNLIPSKSRIGMAQPLYFNFRSALTVFCYATLIILVSHLIFYQRLSNQLVYSKTIDLVKDNDKEVSTDVFELKGPIAPLTIYIDTGVDNSWLATDFSLVNQTTGEAAYFSKDVEYYYGYEDGENWTEGSTADDFNICGVSSGKYKISFKPTKDTNDTYNSEMKIKVYWNQSSNWNFMSVLVAFLAITIFLYYLKHNFEQKRWSESDYSPYSTDED